MTWLKASPGTQFDFQFAAVPLPDQPGKDFLLKHTSFSEQIKSEFLKTQDFLPRRLSMCTVAGAQQEYYKKSSPIHG